MQLSFDQMANLYTLEAIAKGKKITLNLFSFITNNEVEKAFYLQENYYHNLTASDAAEQYVFYILELLRSNPRRIQLMKKIIQMER